MINETEIITNELLGLNDWNYISEQELTEEFIEKFKDKVNWYYIGKHKNLSKEFIEKNLSKLKSTIFEKYEFSEEYIENYISHGYMDGFFWNTISKYQKLSEQFIEKYQNKLDWKKLSRYQNLSENFILKHRKQINIHNIMKNMKFSEEFIKKLNIKGYQQWLTVIVSQDISLDFKHQILHQIGYYDNE